MSTLGKILVTIMFVGVLLWVALTNNASADFSLPPFVETSPFPVAVLILGGIILGFMWGAAIVWFNGSTTRAELRRHKREIKSLEQQISKQGEVV